ncbi:MAG: nucleotidyltransferase domain-containing protein [Hymenobacteraceae bacterium]|nr:nucleotidyltransferase domain-containing protein [Hymenobacteraceae bacterium]
MQYWTDAQHQQLLALCDRYQVARLWLFGSATTDNFDPARSDFDFLVEMVPEEDGLVLGRNSWALLNSLEATLGRQVDLLYVDYIRNPYLWASIERSRQLLYDRTREKVPV